MFFTSSVVVSNSVLTEKRFKKFNSKEEKEEDKKNNPQIMSKLFYIAFVLTVCCVSLGK